MGKAFEYNYFTVFSHYAKGVLIVGEVIRQERIVKNEAKMHLNLMMNALENFQKFLHKGIGPEVANLEDELNSSVFEMIWNLFHMEPNERDAFIQHMNEFPGLVQIPESVKEKLATETVEA